MPWTGCSDVCISGPVQSISLGSNLLVGMGPCLRTCDSTEGMQLNMPLGTYNVFVSANVVLLLDMSHVQRIFMEIDFHGNKVFMKIRMMSNFRSEHALTWD